MSERDDAMTEEERTHTTANLALAARFIDEYLDDPDRFGNIPDGAAVVLLPPDDPAVATANLALADRLAADGRRVVLARVGLPASDHPAWEGTMRRSLAVRTIRPGWAADLDPDRAAVTYDAGRDVLLVDLAGGRRRGSAWPVNEAVAVLVDVDAQEAFGYVVTGFLSHAVRRVPRLALILSGAALRSLTSDELGGLDLSIPDEATDGHAMVRASGVETVSDLIRAIELLSA